MARSISKSFTATGLSSELSIAAPLLFNYSVSGTFVGTIQVERSRNGGMSYEQAVPNITGSASGSVEGGGVFRFRCSAFTSGTVVCAGTESTEVLKVYEDAEGEDVLKVEGDGVTVPKLTVTGDRIVLATVVILTGAGAPVDGTSGTGLNVAGIGSLYIDTTAGVLWIQTGLITSPVWVKVGTQT
jgi:hypothetical protein